MKQLPPLKEYNLMIMANSYFEMDQFWAHITSAQGG